MVAIHRATDDAGEGAFLALRFKNVPGAVVLHDAPEIAIGLQRVLKGWPTGSARRPTDDSSPAVSEVRREGAAFRIESPWLDETLSGLPAASAVCGVVADLVQSFYDGCPDALALHCGAFLIDGRLVAMTGHARAGKSTFMARLSAEPDLRILCDDVLPLLADDSAMGLGVAPRLRLPLPDSATTAFRAHVAAHCQLRDEQYGYVTAPTVAPFGTRAELSILVVLDRRSEADARLHHLPPAEAVRHLLAQNMAPVAPDAIDATVSRLLRLAARLDCLRLVYSDLEPAVALVRLAFSGDTLPCASAKVHPALPDPVPDHEGPAEPVALDTIWQRTPGNSMRRVHDEVFLWHIETGEIYHLNPIAGAIWRLLEKPSSARRISAILAEAFDTPDAEPIRQDVCRLLGGLVANGFLQRVGV